MVRRAAPPPRVEDYADLREWATALGTYMSTPTSKAAPVDPMAVLLAHQTDSGQSISAAVDGIVMFDPRISPAGPVVSRGGQWHPLITGSGVVSSDNNPPAFSLVVGTTLMQSNKFDTTTAADGDLITFDTAFASAPNVVACVQGIDNTVENVAYSLGVSDVTAANFRARVTEVDTAFQNNVRTAAATIAWYAIGEA